ncbi:MAG TPA: hypothetical protein DEG17_18290 [Cyanobacteria bacterium UBA11149]|nr:hypothetical protein [Cyanobacteria bacterium UBA11366]HBK65504.1 hypothetical protein [Cyanobacteria bacterium UBA11166]HBR73470.1 hypothetical protein [Cyanobacteria bacterium UBA11159]HBS71803.1 hypothetical protein [Cyanobacteria bacterium UBA11153]HBW90766.1 hypothetical protein [Cyanobacteria bacterium UBA11149]HCA94269.1 hypothetical protein [Cyanobacteria bacterium UBA9226]
MKTIAILAALSTLLLGSPAIADEYQAQFQGALTIGKQYSYIFYFGEITGDSVVYFFETNSVVGKKITSVCRNNQLCAGIATLEQVEDSKLPQGIPETTSGNYRIISVLKASPDTFNRGNGAGLGYSSSQDISYCSTTLKSRERDSQINVRQGPGINYAIQHYGYGGDMVDILNNQGNPNQMKSARDGEGFLWYQVGFQISRAYGWVREDFLTIPPIECRN